MIGSWDDKTRKYCGLLIFFVQFKSSDVSERVMAADSLSRIRN
jgi:hypothetical protein